MSEVNKIANYNQMMSWLTRPSKPKTQVADLVDDLEPGSLKDELLKDFDPSQETHEEYLRRKNLDRPFNAQDGGRANLAIGGGSIVGENLGTREGFDAPQFRDKNAIKLQNWIKENPDFEYNKFNSMDIAKKAGIKEGDLSTVMANRVLRNEGKDTLRITQAKEKEKLFKSKEFKNFLKSKNTNFKEFSKLSADKKDKLYLYPYQRRSGVLNQLPDKGKNYITAVELSDLLEPFGINYGSFSPDNKQRNTLLAQKINKLLDSKVVSSTGEGTFGKQKADITGERGFIFFKKPTKAQLQEIAKFKDAPNLRPNTVEAMKVLHKKLYNTLKKKNFPTLEKVQTILKNANLENSPAQAARAVSQLARVYGGTQFQNDIGNIKVDKATNKFIIKEFGEYGLLHPWRQGIYTAALDDIKTAVGDEAGDLKKFKNRFDQFLLKKYPGTRTFDLNEVFSVTASARNKSYPYAYFVDVVDSNLNQVDLASFHGQMSLAEERLSDNIKKYKRTGDIKFYNKAEEIKNKFNNQTRKSFLNTIKKNYPGASFNLTKLEIGKPNQVLNNINFAGNFYKEAKLNKWKNLGIDIGDHTAKAGYLKTGADNKGVLAIQELFTSDNKINPSKVDAFVKDINIVKNHAASRGTTFNSFAGFVDFSQSGIELPPAVKQAAERILKTSGTVLRGVGKAAVILDPMFAAYDFSEAIDRGVGGKEAAKYTGKRFVEGVLNLPDLVASGAKFAKDKIQGEDAKFETGTLYKPFTFAQESLDRAEAATPKSTRLRNIAERDFDVGQGATMRTVDDMEIPASKTEIDTAKEKFIESQMGPYYKYGLESMVEEEPEEKPLQNEGLLDILTNPTYKGGVIKT